MVFGYCERLPEWQTPHHMIDNQHPLPFSRFSVFVMVFELSIFCFADSMPGRVGIEACFWRRSCVLHGLVTTHERKGNAIVNKAPNLFYLMYLHTHQLHFNDEGSQMFVLCSRGFC